jgi:hypothetical protein
MSPPEDPEKAVWADLTTIRADYDRMLREAQGSAPTQVVLARGPVGGGKTHASLFFSLLKNWPKQTPRVKDVRILRVPTPKETGRPDRDFYLDVMEHLGLENTSTVIASATEEAGHENASNVLRRIVVSADLTQALLRLGEESDNPLLRAYFMGKCSTSELRKLGLSRNIEKTQDYFRVLAGVFQSWIGFSDSHSPSEHNRVCLWLDEMEDFVYFTPAQYRPFGQGLRELVDRVPFFFTLILNFTLTSPEEFEEIELILGKYLIDRVTQHIFFDEMSEEEMLTYVKELLELYGTPKRETLSTVRNNPLYPFTNNALGLMLSNIPRRTPRDVNKRCRNTLLKAFEENLLAPGKKVAIDRDFIQKMTQEELDKEIG